jgi:hypothetical protein
MEREFLFKVYYGNILIRTIVAHTKWEAVEKIYSRYNLDYPGMIRSKLKAIKS